MATCSVRFEIGSRSDVSSATVLSEEDLSSGVASVATTIAASGVTEEVCVIYPLTSDVRVAWGTSPTAVVTAGPIAYAGRPNVFRNMVSGDKVAVIDAT